MSNQKDLKEKAIKLAARKDGDVGSPEVQISILTSKIENLQNHLKTGRNRKDLHSTRGLIAMVENRKKMIKYLKRKNLEA
jgi:small subunit ribosomal protein S15